MSGCNQSDPSQGGVPLESALANDPYLLKASGVAFEQALHRPIETARLIGSWQRGEVRLPHTVLMPGGYFGRRRPVKPSKFLFSIALLLAVGLSVQYFHIVWKSAESIHPINLLLYWLLWMLFPFVLLAIGTLLKKEGR